MLSAEHMGLAGGYQMALQGILCLKQPIHSKLKLVGHLCVLTCDVGGITRLNGMGCAVRHIGK